MPNTQKFDTNIDVTEHFSSHYKWGLVSLGFCDRIMMVMVLPGCTKTEYKGIEDYLLVNYFFKDGHNSVYCRFKSRDGNYITPEEFDKENYGIREEMTKRLIGKNKLYV
jgi:hypothetical protein